MTDIIAIIGGVLVCGGFWTLIQFLITRHDTKKNKNEHIKEAIAELQKTITKLQESLDENRESMAKQNEALMAMAQDRIVWLGKQFLKDGEISLEDRGNLRRMANAYKDLGGNALVKEVMDAIDELPIKGGK